MFGRLLRFLFALPVALAATAGLYYFGFVRFLDRGADLSEAPVPVAEAPQAGPICLDCDAPPAPNCGDGIERWARCDPPFGPPPKEERSQVIADDFTLVPEPKIEKPSSEIEVPNEVLSIGPASPQGEVIVDNFGPRYPKACIQKRVSGRVTVEFDISPEGAISNARIVQSADKCFNAEVLRAVSKYRYRPVTDETGRPAWRRGARETFNFEWAE